MLLDETVSPSKAFQRLITRCEKEIFSDIFLAPWLTQFGQVTTCAFIITINAKKTSQFKTQCKGDITRKTPDAPLQNELLC